MGPASENINIKSNKFTAGKPAKTLAQPSAKLDRCRDQQKFQVCCRAEDAGHLEASSDLVSVRISQRVRKEGKEELWGSLLIECKEQDDGLLAVEVLVFHPEWDEPIRIASIKSNFSKGSTSEPGLRCDLERKQL